MVADGHRKNPHIIDKACRICSASTDIKFTISPTVDSVLAALLIDNDCVKI